MFIFCRSKIVLLPFVFFDLLHLAALPSVADYVFRYSSLCDKEQ